MTFPYPQPRSRGRLRQSDRGRLPLDVDRYGHGVDIYPEVYFDELYINPCLEPIVWGVDGEVVSLSPRTRSWGSRFQDSATEQYLSASRRVTTGRNQHLRDSSEVMLRSEVGGVYGEQRTRPEIVRDRGRVFPFYWALKELYQKLDAAANFYSNFESEYENDITRIKKYAAREILEKLWTSRVKVTKDRKASLESKHRHNVGDFIEYEDKFAGWKRKVGHALDDALNPCLDEENLDEPKNTRYQSTVRLLDKVLTANRQILPLLDAASKGQEHCKDLITELELLKSLVDPENDNNKKLLKDTDYEDDEEPSGMRNDKERSKHWSGSQVRNVQQAWDAMS
jgi:hypothetical protein